MKCPLIVIDRVNNGWIVSLPPNEPNQYELIGAGIKQFMPNHDFMLEAKKDDDVNTQRQEHIFIFDSFEKVLAFLQSKFLAE